MNRGTLADEAGRMLIHLLAAVLLPIWGPGPTSEPAADLDQTARRLAEATGLDVDVTPTLGTLTGGLARVRVTDARGDGKTFLGVLVDDNVLATMWFPLIDAVDGTATLSCCEDARVVGVIASRAEHNLALLRIDRSRPAHARVDDPTPLTVLTEPPAPGDDARMVIRLPFDMESAVPTVRYERPIVSRRAWHASGGALWRVAFSIEDVFGGAVLVDEQDRPYAISVKGAGADHLFAAPLAPLLEAARHDPVPLAEYGYDARTGRERALYDEELASAARSDGDLPLAERLARRAIANDPDRWRAHYTLGVVLDMTGRATQALEALAESTRLEPGWSESHYSIGIVHLTQDRPAEAIPNLERAIELDGRYDHAHGMLGIARLRAGDVEGSLPSLARAHELDPESVQHAGNYAIALEHAGRADEAVRVWQRVTEADPESATAWGELGGAQFDADEHAAAIESLERAEELAERPDPTRLLRIVIACTHTGDVDRAYDALRRAEVADPDHPLVPRVRALLERDHPRGRP